MYRVSSVIIVEIRRINLSQGYGIVKLTLFV